MGKGATKATKRFAKSGELKRTIDARRRHQKVRKSIEQRKTVQKGKKRSHPVDAEDGDERDDVKYKDNRNGKTRAIDFMGDEEGDGEADEFSGSKKGEELQKMSVDDLFGAGFMDDEEDGQSEGESEEDDLSSIGDLEDEEATHKLELALLKEKDPEFYKYLQENDRELLNFSAALPALEVDDDPDEGFALQAEAEDDDDDDEEEDLPTLTHDMIKSWQKAILETRSLRALRRLILAFRSAVAMNDEAKRTRQPSWKIDDSEVFNKLVMTTLKYIPIVAEHHAPVKVLASGKIKLPAQTPKFRVLQKLLHPYLQSVIHFVDQLSDADMQRLTVQESSKILPYVLSNRKTIRAYLKMCLDLWSTAGDNVRIASLFAMRKLASVQDDSLVNDILKGTYMTLIRTSKTPLSMYNLPTINLMKNSACELYSGSPFEAYQLAFGYIRQLATHLRNSMKVKSKEAYRQVYNWQFVHSIDFWSMVLARSCNAQAEAARGEESALRPLIYPLVQVALGAIQLISGARYHPLHLQVLRSMLHLTQYTRTYIPLSPFIIPILMASLSPNIVKAKSNLRPLNISLHIRCPTQYLRTRVYAECICEEAVFVLGAFCEYTQSSVAFPEITLPLVVTLRKVLKKVAKGSSVSGKCAGMVKTLIEKIEEGGKWVNAKRANVTFAPSNTDDVDKWEQSVKIEETPVGKWMKIQRKAREKKAALADKAREGEDHLLEDEEDDE